MAEHGEGHAHTYKVDFQVGKKNKRVFVTRSLTNIYTSFLSTKEMIISVELR